MAEEKPEEPPVVHSAAPPVLPPVVPQAMTPETITIKDLIIAASQGAAAGIRELQRIGLPIELQEFEIEVNYSCSTEWQPGTTYALGLQFTIINTKFTPETSYKRTTTYGLKARFVFTGKSGT